MWQSRSLHEGSGREESARDSPGSSLRCGWKHSWASWDLGFIGTEFGSSWNFGRLFFQSSFPPSKPRQMHHIRPLSPRPPFDAPPVSGGAVQGKFLAVARGYPSRVFACGTRGHVWASRRSRWRSCHIRLLGFKVSGCVRDAAERRASGSAGVPACGVSHPAEHIRTSLCVATPGDLPPGAAQDARHGRRDARATRGRSLPLGSLALCETVSVLSNRRCPLKPAA